MKWESFKSKTEGQLRRVLEVMEQGPVAVMITDTRGNIEYVNSRFEQMTGYPAGEVIGENPRLLQSGETSEEQYRELWETIIRGEPWRGVLLNKKKSGELYWERALISPVKNAGGRATHFVAIKEDITEVRKIEKEIEEQRLSYFHQSKMAEIGLLAASILHEVANPVAAIDALVRRMELDLRNGTLSKNTGDDLALILNLTQRLTEITRNISEFCSPRPDELKLVDLNGVIRSTCHLVQLDKRWAQISLSMDLDSRLPAFKGYKDQLSHLVINLLVNAADAVQEDDGGKPLISVVTRRAGDCIVLTIDDNGCGMSPEVIKHARDAFFTTKKPGKGTGLGLSLCESIVESHGGELKIDSVSGVGTTVEIYFPAEEAAL